MLRLYTEPCRSNARVPSGGICSSVLDISFHRIKALAAISSPSSAEKQRIHPRDMIGGGGGGREKRERRIETVIPRREREREEGMKETGALGGGFKGDESWG